MIKKGIVFLLTCCLLLLFGACNTNDVTDQAMNIAQAEDPNVLGVKNGTCSAYPGITYGEAFDNFFAQPTWKYFNGTKEGPDDDGDGNPDTIEENIDIVEFTGYCTYSDVEVKALMQFTLSSEDDTFEATYLSFNDVPQNNLMLLGLIDTVFTDPNLTNTEEDELTNDTVELNAPKEANVNTALDQQELFSTPLITYEGIWGDLYSQRCQMEISVLEEPYYSIYIDWGSSAFENTHWEFTGIYDAAIDALVYSDGICYNQYWDDYGNMEEEVVYSNGEGIFYYSNGYLYWADYTEGAGDDCYFERY